MKNKSNKFQIFKLLVISMVFIQLNAFSQKEINALQPLDMANNVNIGILKWPPSQGNQFDLYFGTQSNPPLYKSNLLTNEEKPIILELNKTYYWKVVEKNADKIIKSSKIFSFTTLPIELNANVKYNSFVDPRDYKVYWTTTINGKEWFIQNLDYNLLDYSNYYNDAEVNKIYGRLYKGEALNKQMQNICPSGWHIPTLEEWELLINSYGGYASAGKSLKDKSGKYWQNSNCIGSNESGFTVLPAGSRDSKPTYSNLKKYCFFWTSTPSTKTPESFIKLDFGFMRDQINNSAGNKDWSYSIRCVKD